MKFTLALLPLAIAGLVGVWGAVTGLFFPGTAFIILLGQISGPLFKKSLEDKRGKLLFIATIITFSILFAFFTVGLFHSMAGLHVTLTLSLFGWGVLFTNWINNLKT